MSRVAEKFEGVCVTNVILPKYTCGRGSRAAIDGTRSDPDPFFWCVSQNILFLQIEIHAFQRKYQLGYVKAMACIESKCSRY